MEAQEMTKTILEIASLSLSLASLIFATAYIDHHATICAWWERRKWQSDLTKAEAAYHQRRSHD
jgi:hypothetical protein